MRDDMAQLLVETGRLRDRRRDKALRRPRWRWRHEEEDWGPSRVGLRKGYPRRTAEDYDAPLLRALRRQVGRPWIEVEAEMQRGLDARTLRHWHLLRHLQVMVGHSRAPKGMPLHVAAHPFIVDADTGLLRERTALERVCVLMGTWCVCWIG